MTTPPRKGAQRTNDASSFAALTTKDRGKFLIEQIRENSPDDETLKEAAAILARTRRVFFLAHVEAGFTEMQALQLCLSK